jgi:hypothetical protein
MRSGKKREGEKEETYYDVVPLISQQLQQQQHCFSCGEVIRLKRKADNSGWIRLNLDNTTEHQCIKKKKQQPQVITGSA